MSGPACCILGVCCRKGSDQVKALALEIEGEFGFSAERTDSSVGNASAIAEWVLANYDLVPKGLGVATVNAYEPFFREFFKEKGNAE